MNINNLSISLISDSGISADFISKFCLFLAILLLTTIATGKILKKLLNLPIVAGQIIGGIILGPSIINIKNIHILNEPIKFLDSTKQYICNIASTDFFIFFVLLISSGLTVSYLLWIAGHETDVQDIAKVGIESTLAGFIAAILPIFMITGTLYLIEGSAFTLASAIGQGVVFAATSVSIPIAMLISYGKINLRSSKATIGASIIDDILAIILFSIFIILLQSGALGIVTNTNQISANTSISFALIKMVFAFILMFLVGKLFISPVNNLLDKYKLSHLIPPFATLMMLSYFSLSEMVGGLAGITGAYFAGLFHRTSDKKHRALRAISPFVNSILLPIFLGSIGMQVNINGLNLHHWISIFILLVVAVVAKVFGCFISTWITNFFIKDNTQKWSFWESYLFGSSMVARGEVGLVIATILNSTNLMSANQYVVCVTVIILTSIISPIMLLFGFKQLETKPSDKEFSTIIGPFENLSTRYLFDTLYAYVEKTENMMPIIELSEGEKILTLSENTRIILNSNNAIEFKGNETKIKNILKNIKTQITHDLDKIPVTIED
ncbi:cation:proton antiporter [Candidatus Dependentiae bacterium]|nr:cation:proton antiporter [Candidatus Dependentiae bacterium]MBU4386845.1 cation:proton antiporter [Candidatus Dependentiae bacterium]MCG2756315.1 cation:proton antiporter [Candidatus Dependentiae bacterium]